MVALGQRRKLLDARELIDIDTHFNRIVGGKEHRYDIHKHDHAFTFVNIEYEPLLTVPGCAEPPKPRKARGSSVNFLTGQGVSPKTNSH
jgi:hypothetical protein